MTARNIECQIASAQIGRYLSGDRFSDEALKQLESHVKECDHCQVVLQEKRSALVGKISNSASPAPKPSLTALIETVVKDKEPLTQAVVESPAPTKPKSKLKATPIYYSSALAVVLIGMSFASKFVGGTLDSRGIKDAPKATGGGGKPPTATPSAITAENEPEPTPDSSSRNISPRYLTAAAGMMMGSTVKAQVNRPAVVKNVAAPTKRPVVKKLAPRLGAVVATKPVKKRNFASKKPKLTVKVAQHIAPRPKVVKRIYKARKPVARATKSKAPKNYIKVYREGGTPN